MYLPLVFFHAQFLTMYVYIYIYIKKKRKEKKIKTFRRVKCRKAVFHSYKAPTSKKKIKIIMVNPYENKRWNLGERHEFLYNSNG